MHPTFDTVTICTFHSRLYGGAALSFGDLSGVGVSMGPGSYTGLRIGVATAKGLCFANDIPLLAVNTLEVMAQQCRIPEAPFVCR